MAMARAKDLDLDPSRIPWVPALVTLSVLLFILLRSSSSSSSIRRVEDGLRLGSLPVPFKGRRDRRDLAGVDTIVIHQTAVKGGFGIGSKRLDAAGGDELRGRMLHYLETPYHAIYSPRDRASILQWPAWAYSWHGDGANRYSIGWAYDGQLPGDVLDVEGARAALRHAVETYRRAGVPLRYVEAHRQHDDQRAGDPGAEIWCRVVRPMLRELGLQERPTHTTRDGLTLPPSWLSC